jgi:hypothetical protein
MTLNSDFTRFIPETPILVYPSLATTLGLEEATLLSQLVQFARHASAINSQGLDWYLLHDQDARGLMPFWQAADIQRIATHLREQGLILLASAPFTGAQPLKFAFNEPKTQALTPPALTPTQTSVGSHKQPISSQWQPDRETLYSLAQLGVPQNFALEQLPEFTRYWRERGEPAHSWGSKFHQWIIRRWREFETEQHARSRETYLPKGWRPSDDAMDVITQQGGISRQFAEDAIPEFELFWREKGVKSDHWNKKFCDHVRRQWDRYRLALEHDPTPKRISEQWTPSQDVYDVLRLANIDIPFAQTLLPEFVIYWRDSNQVHTSWNTRFLQFIKYRWANRSSPDLNQHKSTRDLSLVEQLTDRSWAN